MRAGQKFWELVYILKSEVDQKCFYVGSTSDLKRRLSEHNLGDSPHTAQHRPWRLSQYSAFETKEKAEEFERYLKTCSGRKFQKRHL